MKNKKCLASFAIPLLLFVWIWISRIPPSTQPSIAIEAPRRNFLAPTFELDTIAGESVNLADFRGQPVILNFWASWCPPCRAEMPDFQQAWQEYSDSDLIILSVNATHQDTLPEIERFIELNDLAFPILLDTSGTVSSTYQIRALPTTFLIDREGVILKTLIGGPLPLSLLRVEADLLLKGGINASDN
jgi:peroxiredoxin